MNDHNTSPLSITSSTLLRGAGGTTVPVPRTQNPRLKKDDSATQGHMCDTSVQGPGPHSHPSSLTNPLTHKPWWEGTVADNVSVIIHNHITTSRDTE